MVPSEVISETALTFRPKVTVKSAHSSSLRFWSPCQQAKSASAITQGPQSTRSPRPAPPSTRWETLFRFVAPRRCGRDGGRGRLASALVPCWVRQSPALSKRGSKVRLSTALPPEGRVCHGRRRVVLVLEEHGHAPAEARVYAEIVGYGLLRGCWLHNRPTLGGEGAFR